MTHIPSVIKEPLTKEFHGAEKPVKLLKRLIDGLTQEGDTVVDCFSGSASTGAACIETKRNFIGFELDKTYFDLSVKRLTEMSMQTELF